MSLEQEIQREIENTIEEYIKDYKEQIDENTEDHIIMIKMKLYISINEKFNEIRQRIMNKKDEK